MSILQRILNKVDGQVSEDFFRQQLIDELGSTNFDDDDYADTGWICTWRIVFLYISSTDKTTIL